MNHINEQDHLLKEHNEIHNDTKETIQVEDQTLKPVKKKSALSKASALLKRNIRKPKKNRPIYEEVPPTANHTINQNIDTTPKEGIDPSKFSSDHEFIKSILDQPNQQEKDDHIEAKFDKLSGTKTWKTQSKSRFGFRSKTLKTLDKEINTYLNATLKPDNLAEETYHLVRLNNVIRHALTRVPKSLKEVVIQLQAEVSNAIESQKDCLQTLLTEPLDNNLKFAQTESQPLKNIRTQFEKIKQTQKDLKKTAEIAIETGTNYKVKDFATLKALMSMAKRSTHPEKTTRFLNIYNHQVAPKLTRESDALEYLAVKIAYLKLDVGDTIKLAPKTLSTETRHSRYAHSYKVSKTIIDTSGKTGMVAYAFTPYHDDGKEDLNANPLLVFRGTAMKMDKSAKAEGHRSGVADDLNYKGIGYKAFEKYKGEITDWITTQLNTPNRDISVIGHSLGGALASRTMCEVPSETQARIHLSTFQPPGLDTATAKKFDSIHANNVVHFMTSGDPVTRAGKHHLPTSKNTILSYAGGSSRKNNHLETPGTTNVLNGDTTERHSVPIENFAPKSLYETLRLRLLRPLVMLKQFKKI